MKVSLLDELRDTIRKEMCIGPLNTLEARLIETMTLFMVKSYQMGYQDSMEKIKSVTDKWLVDSKKLDKKE